MTELQFGHIRDERSADVIVVGGGPAGMCAAIAAARQGVSVILVEQGGFCGGMATRGMVGPFMTCYDAEGRNMIIRGIWCGIVKSNRIRGENTKERFIRLLSGSADKFIPSFRYFC